MRIFACSSCQNPIYFENFLCTGCGARLAFVPELAEMVALAPRATQGGLALYDLAKPRRGHGPYRMCRNSDEFAVCNWAVPASDPEELCRACRLNGVIPPLSDPALREGWARIEAQKRRLLYSLRTLALPLESRAQRPEGGLEFAFMADSAEQKVFTGHSDGLITINVAEADDPFREKLKQQLGETYRTLLGHFRHEIGHYYWDRLVKDSPRHEAFRALFGDERLDYAQAVERHYAEGAPAQWSDEHVSAYATMHPWEDWAETWAHYLHLRDTLESARSHELSFAAPRRGNGKAAVIKTRDLDSGAFEGLIGAWIPLTLALNSLNRSMGLADAYPFVLTPRVIEKLRFVHDVVSEAGREPRDAPS